MGDIFNFSSTFIEPQVVLRNFAPDLKRFMTQIAEASFPSIEDFDQVAYLLKAVGISRQLF